MFWCGINLYSCVVFFIWDLLGFYWGFEQRGFDFSWGFGMEVEKSEEDEGVENDVYEVV